MNKKSKPLYAYIYNICLTELAHTYIHLCVNICVYINIYVKLHITIINSN
jgi:hypothetical protein